MKLKNKGIIVLIVSSLFLIASFSAEAADVTITDGTSDVNSVDYLTTETTIVTSSPYIDVDDIDLTETTYAQQGVDVTLTLKVKGSILDRGNINDFSGENFNINVVGYYLTLSTSDELYQITYVNTACQLMYSDETMVNLTPSDYSIVGDTFTVTFALKNTNETYDSLQASTQYLKWNITAGMEQGIDETDYSEMIVSLTDVAPNPPLEIMEAYAPNVGSTEEKIQFNGSLAPLSGQPPFQYSWDFGDGSTPVEQQNPTHAYTKAGTFTYNLTVTDQSNTTTFMTGTITITSEEPASFLSTQMILFLAVLLIIIVIGIVIIVWIIRR